MTDGTTDLAALIGEFREALSRTTPGEWRSSRWIKYDQRDADPFLDAGHVLVCCDTGFSILAGIRDTQTGLEENGQFIALTHNRLGELLDVVEAELASAERYEDGEVARDKENARLRAALERIVTRDFACMCSSVETAREALEVKDG